MKLKKLTVEYSDFNCYYDRTWTLSQLRLLKKGEVLSAGYNNCWRARHFEEYTVVRNDGETLRMVFETYNVPNCAGWKDGEGYFKVIDVDLKTGEVTEGPEREFRLDMNHKYWPVADR